MRKPIDFNYGRCSNFFLDFPMQRVPKSLCVGALPPNPFEEANIVAIHRSPLDENRLPLVVQNKSFNCKIGYTLVDAVP